MGKEVLRSMGIGLTGLRPPEEVVTGLTPSPDGVNGKVDHTLFFDEFDEIDSVRKGIDVDFRPCEVKDPVEGWPPED